MAAGAKLDPAWREEKSQPFFPRSHRLFPFQTDRDETQNRPDNVSEPVEVPSTKLTNMMVDEKPGALLGSASWNGADVYGVNDELHERADGRTSVSKVLRVM